MSGKIIFLDIDGTLTLPGSNEPPQSALDAIKKAQSLGHKVYLCTGRNPAMLSPLLKYGFDGAVASAGGYIFSGDTVIYDCPMTEDQRQRSMDLFKANGVYRTIEAKDASYCDDGMAEFMGRVSGGNSELVRWRKAIESSLNIQSISKYDGRPIYKIIFMCETLDQLKPAIESLEDEFYFLVQDATDGSYLNGELINKQFDKGEGVRRVVDHLGADMKDTIGFGDSMNDLEMIEAVAYGVCMENGSPTLKNFSQMVCPSVEDDGLAKAFADLGLLG